ncbi:MAG TPA: type VII secretion protein EccE [Actinocatenispora sp.]
MRARRRSGRIGGVSVLQLLVAEGVLVGVALVFLRHPIVGLIAIVLGILLLVLAFGRSGGRWWTETLALRWQYRRRRGVRPALAEDTRLTALRALTPDLVVRERTLQGDQDRIGVGQDGAGWFAVATVLPPAGIRTQAVAPLPVEKLIAVLAEAGQPGTVLQIVTHTMPAAGMLVAGPAYADSYRELVGVAGEAPPQEQALWVAVRADAQTVARTVVDGAATDDVPAMVATLTRRVTKMLRRDGFRAEILDPDGLVDALITSSGLDAYDPHHATAREDWTAWYANGLAHATFWVRSWPGLPAAAAMLERLAATPAAFTSVTLILEPQETEISLRCLARVAAPAEVLAVSCQTLETAARQFGAELFRLDGEQAPAAYASAPSGGGAR